MCCVCFFSACCSNQKGPARRLTSLMLHLAEVSNQVPELKVQMRKTLFIRDRRDSAY